MRHVVLCRGITVVLQVSSNFRFLPELLTRVPYRISTILCFTKFKILYESLNTRFALDFTRIFENVCRTIPFPIPPPQVNHLTHRGNLS